MITNKQQAFLVAPRKDNCANSTLKKKLSFFNSKNPEFPGFYRDFIEKTFTHVLMFFISVQSKNTELHLFTNPSGFFKRLTRATAIIYPLLCALSSQFLVEHGHMVSFCKLSKIWSKTSAKIQKHFYLDYTIYLNMLKV